MSIGSEESLRTGRQIADHYGVDVHTVRRWRYDGMPAVVLNPKMVRYRPSEVEAWHRSRPVKTAERFSKVNAPGATDKKGGV
jgi:hypothetical protein